MFYFPTNVATKCRLKPALYGTTYDPPFKNVFLPDEKLTVQCGEEFWISDPLKRSVEATCNADGQWSIRPVCKGTKTDDKIIVLPSVFMGRVFVVYGSFLFLLEVTCRNQRDRNVRSWDAWRNEVLKMGREIRYACNRGYKSTDDSNLAKCTREGWKPDPLCEGMVNIVFLTLISH